MSRFQTDEDRLQEIARKWQEPVEAVDAPTGRPWENQISTEEYMQLLHAECSYCGDLIGFNYLEPINEAKPLHVKNILRVCLECKRLKGNSSREEYKSKAEKARMDEEARGR